MSLVKPLNEVKALEALEELRALLSTQDSTFLDKAIAEGAQIDVFYNRHGKPRCIVRAYKIQAGQLFANDWNPNGLAEIQEEALDESIGLFGQFIEIVVRPRPKAKPGLFEILDGEHRSNLLKDPSRWNREISTNVMLGLSNAEAKKITLIANEHGVSDPDKLAIVLKNIHIEVGSLEETKLGLPYTSEGLLRVIQLNSEQNKNGNGNGNKSNSDDEEWRDVVCRVPISVFNLLMDAAKKLGEEAPYHQDAAIAWGQVLERLVAEYLLSLGYCNHVGSDD